MTPKTNNWIISMQEYIRVFFISMQEYIRVFFWLSWQEIEYDWVWNNFNQLNKPKHLKHLNISCKCLTFSSVEKVQNENYYFLVTLIAFVDLIFLVYEKVGIGLNNLLFHSFLVNDVIRQSLSHLYKFVKKLYKHFQSINGHDRSHVIYLRNIIILKVFFGSSKS